MQIPYANVNQYLSASLLNRFFQAFAEAFGEGYTRFFYPGFVNPELISVSGTVGAISVTVNQNASLMNGEGLIATAYTNQTFTLNATQYASSSSNVTIYIYASVGQQLTSPITITPPPIGSPSYNPELSAQTGYQYNTLTFQWGISTTPPDGKTNILYATAVIPAGASSSTPLTFTPQVAQVSGVMSQIPIFVLTSNSVVSLPAGYGLNGFTASLPTAQYPGQVFSFMGPGTIGTTQSYPIVGLLPNGQSLTSITLQANESMQLVSTGQNWLVADAAPINLQGAAFANYLNVSSATTLTNTQTGSIVLVSGSNYAITLPEPAQNTVFQFISNGATGISIVPPSGVSIYVNNTAQSSINFNDSYALLYANGTNWYVAGASTDIWGIPDNVGYTFGNITVNGSAIVNDLNASHPTSAPAYVATNGAGNYWLAGIGDAAGGRWLIGDAGNDQIGFYNDTSTSLVPPNFTGYSAITGPNSETYYLRSALDPSGNFKTIGNIYATDGAVFYPNGVPSNNTAIQVGQNVPAQYAGILINTSGYSNNAIQVNNNSTTEFYIDQNGNVWSQGNVTVGGGMQVYPNGVPTGLNGILIGEPVGGQTAPLFINTSGNGNYAFQINDGSTQLFNVQPGGNLFSLGNATIGGSLTAGSISTGGAISGNTLNLSGDATVGGSMSVSGAIDGASLSISGNANIGNETIGGTGQSAGYWVTGNGLPSAPNAPVQGALFTWNTLPPSSSGGSWSGSGTGAAYIINERGGGGGGFYFYDGVNGGPFTELFNIQGSGDGTPGQVYAAGGYTGPTLNLTGNATVGGSLAVSDNATISGAIYTDIPSTSTLFNLPQSVTQVRVNVADFSSPQDAVNYVQSLGGGVVFFPEGSWSRFTITGNNIVIEGAGPGSIISGIDIVPSNNTYSTTTTSSGSSVNTIPLSSMPSQGLDGWYVMISGSFSNSGINGPLNTYVTSSGPTNPVTVSSSVSYSSGTGVWFSSPNLEYNGFVIRNVSILGNGWGIFAVGVNGISIENCVLNGYGNDNPAIVFDRCINYSIRNNRFVQQNNYESSAIVWISDYFTTSLSGSGIIQNNYFATDYLQNGTPTYGTSTFLNIINHSGVHIDHNRLDWGYWGAGTNDPTCFIQIAGQCQAIQITNNYASAVWDFVRINSYYNIVPSHITIENNVIDLIGNNGICNTQGNSTHSIVIRGNEVDNPFYIITGIASISAAGSGYTENEVVTLGTPAAGSEMVAATATVTSVSSGGITGLRLNSTGMYDYTNGPAQTTLTVYGSSGSGATVTVNWSGSGSYAYIQNAQHVVVENNDLFCYSMSTYAGVQLEGCYSSIVQANRISSCHYGVACIGSQYSFIRENIISSVPLSSLSTSPLSNSAGIWIAPNGSTANYVVDIQGNEIRQVTWAGHNTDSSAQYIFVAGDNAIASTNTSSFFDTNPSSSNLVYEEHWNPASFHNTVIFDSTLLATGTADFTGNVTVGGSLSGASADFSGNVTVGGSLSGASADFSGNVTVGSALTAGSAVISGNLSAGTITNVSTTKQYLVCAAGGTTGSITVPSGVQWVRVRVWGGGGGGGGSTSGNVGQGGAGGGYAEGIYQVAAGETISYTAGGGGGGGSGDGGGGGTSSVVIGTTTISASGGAGGLSNATPGDPPPSAGQGSGGTINIPGNDGVIGTIVSSPSGTLYLTGQGGGAFGGSYTPIIWTGSGGASGGWGGVFPGGGGSGGMNGGAGAPGASGLVIVEVI